MLQSLQNRTKDLREQNIKTHTKKTKNIEPIPCLPTYTLIEINHMLPIRSPIVCTNTMDKKFLLRVEQSNKCGSVTINKVFNVPLGSGTGSLVSIPNRPFSLARHQLHSLIQSAQTITQK